jgi:hypothetical protein
MAGTFTKPVSLRLIRRELGMLWADGMAEEGDRSGALVQDHAKA